MPFASFSSSPDRSDPPADLRGRRRRHDPGSLEKLVALNLESRRELEAVADVIRDEKLANLFSHLAFQRGLQARELNRFVSSRGAETNGNVDSSTKTRAVYLRLRASLEGGSVADILREVERAESLLEDRYTESLESAAGSATSDVIRRHHREIGRQHELIRDLLEVHQPNADPAE